MTVLDTVKAAIPAMPSITLPTLPVTAAELQADAKKLPFAVVGAGDTAVSRVRAEVPTLPATVTARIEQLRSTVPAKVEELAKAQLELVKTLPSLARTTFESKVVKPAEARRQAFHKGLDSYADRGEKVVAGLRKDSKATTPVAPVVVTPAAPAVVTPAKKATAKKA